jgi:pimeloyl-ACP methyl ester carboxylesterase
MDGHRHAVTSADGTGIGLLTAGDGPPLLLVHGGMGCIENWQPMWKSLTGRWQVTAMDRRGRGASRDDVQRYELRQEFEDVAALRDAPREYDVRPIVSATMPRETGAVGTVDLKALAAGVEVEVLLLLGSASPAWAHATTGELAAVLTHKTLAVLDGQGHDAISLAPELLVTQLAAFFS